MLADQLCQRAGRTALIAARRIDQRQVQIDALFPDRQIVNPGRFLRIGAIGESQPQPLPRHGGRQLNAHIGRQRPGKRAAGGKHPFGHAAEDRAWPGEKKGELGRFPQIHIRVARLILLNQRCHRMARMGENAHLVAHHRIAGDFLSLGHDEGHIQFPRGDPLFQPLALLLVDDHLHLRVELIKPAHDPGQQVGAAIGADAKLNAPAAQLLNISQLSSELVVLEEDLLRAFDKNFPRIGEPHPAGCAHEELSAQFGFIFLQKLAQA